MVGVSGTAVVASAVGGTWTAASQVMQNQLEPLRNDLDALKKDVSLVKENVAVVKEELAKVRESQQRVEAILLEQTESTR